jgi:3-oxoacyl-[acyl-carrier-protein] synthase-3
LLINISKNRNVCKNILVIGSEVHSSDLDMTSVVAEIFGDGAGAAVLSRE